MWPRGGSTWGHPKPEVILPSLTLLVFERFFPVLTLWLSPNSSTNSRLPKQSPHYDVAKTCIFKDFDPLVCVKLGWIEICCDIVVLVGRDFSGDLDPFRIPMLRAAFLVFAFERRIYAKVNERAKLGIHFSNRAIESGVCCKSSSNRYSKACFGFGFLAGFFAGSCDCKGE